MGGVTELPDHSELDINALSRCFKNVVNSYKFYWLLSILDHLNESDNPKILLDDLSMRMLSLVWYPLDYYKLSFGKQDGFIYLAQAISKKAIIDNSINAPSLREQLQTNLNPIVATKLKRKVKIGLRRWVTYRFLSPFFEQQVKGLKDQQVNEIILKLSNTFPHKNFVPYSINADYILLNPLWCEYFIKNQTIIRGFINWHLLRFLQKNNPNTIGLSEKLSRPVQRDLKVAKIFWSDYLRNNEHELCIYSKQSLYGVNFSIDHFIPWSYMAHDQLWNLLPTLKQVNSAKSDILPNLDSYLDSFILLQFNALQYHATKGHFKLLEDYHTLFKITGLTDLSFELFQIRLTTEIGNHYRIASNQGFPINFVYQGIQG